MGIAWKWKNRRAATRVALAVTIAINTFNVDLALFPVHFQVFVKKAMRAHPRFGEPDAPLPPLVQCPQQVPLPPSMDIDCKLDGCVVLE